MAKPFTHADFIKIHSSASNIPIWVWVDGDTYRLTTLGEYWSDIFNTPEVKREWEEVFK
jgi:hypothetical protein